VFSDFVTHFGDLLASIVGVLCGSSLPLVAVLGKPVQDPAQKDRLRAG